MNVGRILQALTNKPLLDLFLSFLYNQLHKVSVSNKMYPQKELPLLSILCYQSFAINHLISILSYQSFAINPLLSVICYQSFTINPLLSII